MSMVRLPYYSNYSSFYWMRNLAAVAPLYPNRAVLTPSCRLNLLSRKTQKSYRQDEASACPISAREDGDRRSQSLSIPYEIQKPYLAITDFSCFTMRARASCARNLSVRRAFERRGAVHFHAEGFQAVRDRILVG